LRVQDEVACESYRRVARLSSWSRGHAEAAAESSGFSTPKRGRAPRNWSQSRAAMSHPGELLAARSWKVTGVAAVQRLAC